MEASKSSGPRTEKPVRCVIYPRVSTEEQGRAEYSSIESQIDICTHYVAVQKEAGWVVTNCFEDRGYSGKDMNRPGIQALLSEVRAGNVDVVISYKIDRASRYLPDFYSFLETLKRYNVTFVSATQAFDTSTPFGMLVVNILVVFAQFEREITVERIQDKLHERAKKGIWNGSPDPLGYTYDKTTQGLKQNQYAAVISKMYKAAVRLRNGTKVAIELNDAGFRTAERVWTRRNGVKQNVGGKRFTLNSIKRLLASPLYKGYIRHNGKEYRGGHEPIVSEDLWKAANDALTDQRTGEPRLQSRDKHVCLLKGLLRCGHCGKALTPTFSSKKNKAGKPYIFYVCTDVGHYQSASTCPLRRVPGRPFEDLVIGYLAELGKHPDVIHAALKASNDAKSKGLRPLRSKLSELQKTYRKLCEEVRTCIELAKRKGADQIGAEFMREADRMSAEKNKVESDKASLEMEIVFREKSLADKDLIAKTLLDFGAVVRTLPLQEQKELMQLIIKEIEVTRFDPKQDSESADKGVFTPRIRTKWYKVKMSLFASDLIPKCYKFREPSSHFRQDGGPRGI